MSSAQKLKRWARITWCAVNILQMNKLKKIFLMPRIFKNEEWPIKASLGAKSRKGRRNTHHTQAAFRWMRHQHTKFRGNQSHVPSLSASLPFIRITIVISQFQVPRPHPGIRNYMGLFHGLADARATDSLIKMQAHIALLGAAWVKRPFVEHVSHSTAQSSQWQYAASTGGCPNWSHWMAFWKKAIRISHSLHC